MNNLKMQQQLLTDISTFSEDSLFNSQGIEIYQRNLLFSATNALANSYPTINLLLGNDLLRVLTKAFIIAYPKSSFDWATWGSEFPVWLKQHPISDDIGYLHDCALLDWCIHENYKILDTHLDVNSMYLLTSDDLHQIYLKFNAGNCLIISQYPIVDIYQAHRTDAENPDLSLANDKFKNKKGQSALITLEGWKSIVREVNSQEIYWLDLINNPQSLGSKLENLNQNKESNSLPFEEWLPIAIEQKIIYKFINKQSEKT